MTATDSGSPPLTSNSTLTVTVTDLNDNAPEFNNTAFNFMVAENLPSGAQVGVFEVTDRDRGLAAESSFTLTGQDSGRFSVELISVTQMSNVNSQPPVVTLARIVTTQALDREDVELYQFTLMAQDLTNMPLFATVPVNVTVLDVNDNGPVFPSSSYAFNTSEGTTVSLITEFTVSIIHSALCYLASYNHVAIF